MLTLVKRLAYGEIVISSLASPLSIVNQRERNKFLKEEGAHSCVLLLFTRDRQASACFILELSTWSRLLRVTVHRWSKSRGSHKLAQDRGRRETFLGNWRYCWILLHCFGRWNSRNESEAEVVFSCLLKLPQPTRPSSLIPSSYLWFQPLFTRISRSFRAPQVYFVCFSCCMLFRSAFPYNHRASTTYQNVPLVLILY